MKRYQGIREGQVALVTVDGQPLNPRLDLWNHSPTGFEWAYNGSGLAQLALGILAHHLNDDEDAVGLHQEFKHAVIANLPYRGWTLTENEVHAIVELIRDEAQNRSVPDPSATERKTL
jgi:hypothetical protein